MMACLPFCTCRQEGSIDSLNMTELQTKCYDDKMEYRILLIGRSGSGKSATANSILGASFFKVGSSLFLSRHDPPTTRHAELAEDVTRLYKVIDTADVTRMRGEAAENEILQWKALASPDPTAILMTVPADVNFTPEDLAAYRQMRKLLDQHLVYVNLIVVFTFADRICPDSKAEIEGEMEQADSELHDLVKGQARGRYVFFDNTATDIDRYRQVRRLLDIITPGK